jgi:hypothetical protein
MDCFVVPYFDCSFAVAICFHTFSQTDLSVGFTFPEYCLGCATGIAIDQVVKPGSHSEIYTAQISKKSTKNKLNPHLFGRKCGIYTTLIIVLVEVFPDYCGDLTFFITGKTPFFL